MTKTARCAAWFAALTCCQVLVAQEPVLLEFTRDDCGYCREMEPIVRQLKSEGLPIRQIDANRELALAQQMRVTGLPTFVLVQNGREVSRIRGATSAAQLRQMLAKVRPASPPAGPTLRGQSPDRPTESPFATPGRLETPATYPAGTSASVSDAQLIAATVRIRVEDPQGVSHGTGTVIHAAQGEAWVLTCGHLFRETNGEAPAEIHFFQLVGGQSQQTGTAQAVVHSFDLKRDIALMRFPVQGSLAVAPVAAGTTPYQPGDGAMSVGCDRGAAPTVWHSRITQLDPFAEPANAIEVDRMPVEGRSGGGLFNEHGELIGICFAADPEANQGLYVGLPEIRAELAEEGFPGLDTIGPGSHQPPQHQFAGAAAPGRTTQPPIVPITPAEANSPAAVPRAVAVPGAGTELADATNPMERAALEEINRQAAGGEVIVIIRPQTPGERCEIITIDKPSPQFLNSLAEMGNRAIQPRMTNSRSNFTPLENSPVRKSVQPRPIKASIRPTGTRYANRDGYDGWSSGATTRQ